MSKYLMFITIVSIVLVWIMFLRSFGQRSVR